MSGVDDREKNDRAIDVLRRIVDMGQEERGEVADLLRALRALLGQKPAPKKETA